MSAGDQNAILVAAALKQVMKSNDVRQQPNIYQDSTNEQTSQQSTIIAFQENQAENVLASIRLPPAPPSDLTIIQEPTAHPIFQRPNTNNEDLIQLLPE